MRKEDKIFRLTELRILKNYTIEQMAENIGVTPEEYAAYEDETRRPTLKSLSKICDFLTPV